MYLGPMFLHHMYPYERFMSTMNRYAKSQVHPKVISSPKLARPPLLGSSKGNLKDFVVGNEKAKSASKSATIEKPKSGTTIEKSASKETVAAPKPASKPS
jgi:hypothetical protein